MHVALDEVRVYPYWHKIQFVFERQFKQLGILDEHKGHEKSVTFKKYPIYNLQEKH